MEKKSKTWIWGGALIIVLVVALLLVYPFGKHTSISKPGKEKPTSTTEKEVSMDEVVIGENGIFDKPAYTFLVGKTVRFVNLDTKKAHFPIITRVVSGKPNNIYGVGTQETTQYFTNTQQASVYYLHAPNYAPKSFTLAKASSNTELSPWIGTVNGQRFATSEIVSDVKSASAFKEVVFQEGDYLVTDKWNFKNRVGIHITPANNNG